MIRINLFPPEEKKVASGQKVSIPLRPVGIGAGGFVVALTLALVAGNAWNAGRLSRLRQEWDRMQPQRAGLEQKQAQLKMLQGQAGLLDQVKAPHGRWAPRLNLLSDAVVSEVWFTELKVNPGQPVQLKGSALVAGSGESGAAVTRFLQRLKEQPGFQDWFHAVDLQSVEHRQIGQEDVVDFAVLLTPTGG